jgi:hypothetical protein
MLFFLSRLIGRVWLIHCKLVTVATVVDPFDMSVQFVVSTAIKLLYLLYCYLFVHDCPSGICHVRSGYD